VKYGGSILWAAMVFFLVAIAASNLPRQHVAMIGGRDASAWNCFDCSHPWLDEFRLTLAGALLLGRIFSLWDMLAMASSYFGMLLDRFGLKRDALLREFETVRSGAALPRCGV